MKRNNYIKYYRVFKNQTAVTEISTNDFKPSHFIRFKRGLPLAFSEKDMAVFLAFCYSLPADQEMYYGYTSKTRAMEKAKEGALTYINRMIDEVVQGIKKLKDYRSEHHPDLNITLLDANIRKLEREMHIK